MDDVVRVGVIGCGRWGPNHIRVFSELLQSSAAACADVDPDRLQAMQERFPWIETTTSATDLIGADNIDAVVIASPVPTHKEIVTAALQAGKDVLCEKPLDTSSAACMELANLADETGRILMVGHVFLYNAGILRLKEEIASGRIGKLYYLHATRTNLGPVRTDVGAVADLATHDISILNFVIGQNPEVASVAGGRYLQEQFEDVAFISLRYPSGVLASIHVSWLDPVKVRRIVAVGSEKMVVWDDLGTRGPIEIHDRRVTRDDYLSFGEFQLMVREGDMVMPSVRMVEPLRAQAKAFVDAVKTRKTPYSDARFAAEIAEVLKNIEQRISQNDAS